MTKQVGGSKPKQKYTPSPLILTTDSEVHVYADNKHFTAKNLLYISNDSTRLNQTFALFSVYVFVLNK